MGFVYSSKANRCDMRLQGADGDVPAGAKPFPSLTLLLNLNLKVNEWSSPIDPNWADEHHALRRACSQCHLPLSSFCSCLPFTPFQSHQSEHSTPGR